MNVDLIPSSQLHRNWIEFIKTLDTRIESGIAPELSYHQQINCVLDKIINAKKVGTAYIKLDLAQQELIETILMKELNT